MEIDINQKKISIGDKYQVFIDGQPTHKASRQLFKLLPQIKLFDTATGSIRTILNKRFTIFIAKYDITRNDNIFHLITRSYWKRHYQCLCGTDTYDIYGHRGRKYSIYKNGIQVAWWDKKAVTWFAGDNYKITADKDCDADMIISFCLIMDNFASNNSNGNMITFNVGHIGPQAKKFDPNWRPKY